MEKDKKLVSKIIYIINYLIIRD